MFKHAEDQPSAASSGVLVALHRYYLDRSSRFDSAVASILKTHPTIQDRLVFLTSSSSTTPTPMDALLPTESEGEREGEGGAYMRLVSSIKDLCTLASEVAPAVVTQIQKEIKMELEEAKKKQFGGTDTPLHVLMASEERAGDAPVALATKVVNSQRWQLWKFRLRTALIESSIPNTATPTTSSSYAARFQINSLTSDELAMSTTLYLTSTGPGLDGIARDGLDARTTALPPSPVLQSFIFLTAQQVVDRPEPDVLEYVSHACMNVCTSSIPTEFTCRFFYNARSSGTGTADDDIEITGGGEELRILYMSLASIVEGEDMGRPEKGVGAFIPSDGRIQVRRGGGGGGKGELYEIQVYDGSGSIRSIKVDSTRMKALIECLDAYALMHPVSFGLPLPTLQVPKIPLYKRILHGLGM